MQRQTGISPSEWRWVITFSGLLVAITLLPYAWAIASDSPTDSWQFMGILANPLDGATYLSKIGEGLRGDLLYTLQYTPEPHQGAAIQEFYLFLGHIARIIGLSPVLMFHIARLVTGFIMFLSLYHLGSVIWPRLRPRRLFFSLLAVGSGLGWLYLVFFPVRAMSQAGGAPLALPTDFSIPESIPFFATFVNPHFPLAIALIALIAATFVVVFRPGFNMQPNLVNGGIGLALLTVALAIVQPQGLVAITVALVVYLLVLTWRSRRLPLMEINWVILVILPALPFLIYYLAVTRDNWAMRIWNEQNATLSPSPIFYLVGYGLLLLAAIPGMWRAIRRFERDGDRFMIIWLVVNILLLYAPFNLQRRMAIGLIIPIVYFTVRALEDYWFHQVKPPLREALLIAFFVFVVPSNILSMLIPIFGIIRPESGIAGRLLLPAEEGKAIDWLGTHARRDNVVLAPENVSLWIPAYTGLRVVSAHPYETVNYETKQAEVAAWFDGQGCQELLTKYDVRYVISPPISSDQPPSTGCYSLLGDPIASFNNVFVYAVP